MADNLPLIPEKDSVCADVRPVLREVFRELDCLPPLAAKPGMKARDAADGGLSPLPKVEPWVDKYETSCKEIWQREGELKQQHAKRICRDPLPNIYKLYPPKEKLPTIPTWKKDQGILLRSDLMPSIVQNVDRENSLWVRNILNRSSGDLASVKVRGSKVHMPVKLGTPRDTSLQSLSMGEVIPVQPYVSPPPPPPPPLPEYILCVPPQLDFINFTVGQLHTQRIRLVNVSKFECRLSIRPPVRRELDIELGTRGLTVTSGAAAELKVHFRPRDVRVLRDVLLVRVLTGRSLVVPICCYMEPPILHILVPAVPMSIASSSPVKTLECPSRGVDVLELGSCLLGDVHSVKIILTCEAAHADFFLLTEDAWLSFCLDALTPQGSVVAESFVLEPARWRGGGAVRGRAWCRAPRAGLHAALLRVLSSTGIVRPLHLLADSLYFRPDHITIEALKKDYDICSDDDPDCEYYVHLGTAFPRHSLTASVQLVNHSPVLYSYYWSVRPWGVCSCWEEKKDSSGSLGPEEKSKSFCVGAKEARDMELQGTASLSKFENSRYIRVEPTQGTIAPRSSLSVRVCAPDVGSNLGTQRAVLMLILKDIPKESFPNDYEPMIIKTKTVNSEPVPGFKEWTREVCEVVCTQMEVWWDVVPIRFVLDPPILPLMHSRRVHEVDISVRATQLFGPESIRGQWLVPIHMSTPPIAKMTSDQSCDMTIRCPLPMLPNHYPETDVITLRSTDMKWESRCRIVRSSAARHPALRPARAAAAAAAASWLGVQPPGARVHATLNILNDTHQHIFWCVRAYRWHGERPASRACAGRAPCASCREQRCTCALARPARGALEHGVSATIYYDVRAPEVDGSVATLVQAQRTSADVSQVTPGSGMEARASLFNYRVLAPRLTLRVLPCAGDKGGACATCMLDEGALGSPRGTATLRPRAAIALGRVSCYRLQVTNITPIATAVTWDAPLEEDILKAMFIPKEMQILGYGSVDFHVVLDAKKVCGRRIFVFRAKVRHAYKPLYLLIDTAIAGLEISCHVPIGEGLKTDSTLIIRRSQQEEFPWDADKVKPTTPNEMFQEEDRKRAVRADNICQCHFELVYIPPPPSHPAPPPAEAGSPPVEIIWEPPPLTRVCPCFKVTKPILQEHMEPFCLQFKNMPLKTVCSRKVLIRNESVLAASWRSAVRRWPRHHTRTLNKDEWADDVRSPGLVVQCVPRDGVLSARGSLQLDVQLYADCWGLYHEQLLIKIDHLDAIVLDIWVEAVGAPLLFALSLEPSDEPLKFWMSYSDPQRTLRVKNNSRTELTVHSYVLTDNEHAQDVLPFRLYLRLYDVAPRTCPCRRPRALPRIAPSQAESLFGEESAESDDALSIEEEMDTMVEVFLAPDYGCQDKPFYKICPETATVQAGSWMEWKVTLVTLLAPPHAELAPPTTLLFRSLPVVKSGESWFRGEPPAQAVRLRQAERRGLLKASVHELCVRLCALDLPFENAMRVRKRFRIQNVGCGPLAFTARVKEPWALVRGDAGRCYTGCCSDGDAELHRDLQVPMYLEPRSSMEVCAEASVRAAAAWPAPAPAPEPARAGYAPRMRTCTTLRCFDTDNLLLSIPLYLDLEFPVIDIEPALLDFGIVADDDTAKSYFTVSHSSHTETIEMVTEWLDGKDFRVWPRHFSLAPGARQRIYIQYTARWSGAPVEVSVAVRSACGAGAWCRAAGRARAAPARSVARRGERDHTDDDHLLPRDLCT